MAGISNYVELKSAIADWLVRTDLTTIIPTFVDNFESVARRDPRIRNLVSVDFSVDTIEEDLPTDFRELESLWHDGPTYEGEIEIVSAGSLPEFGAGSSTTGVVCAAAINPDTQVIRFAPPPSETFALKMRYWATIVRLGDSVQSNWLLAEHSDIYLYGCLIETAPYVKNDSRLPVWRSEYDRRLAELDANIKRGQWGGSLVRRPSRNFNVGE